MKATFEIWPPNPNPAAVFASHRGLLGSDGKPRPISSADLPWHRGTKQPVPLGTQGTTSQDGAQRRGGLSRPGQVKSVDARGAALQHGGVATACVAESQPIRRAPC